MSEIREDLKYTEDHEWVKIEDGVATVGVTDFAQRELGDIVYIECDVAPGEEVSQGDVFGTIEAVKTVSDLFSPVSGEVLEINDSLEDDPEKVNQDPYGEAWIIKIKISDESDNLLDHNAYKELVGE